MPAESLSPPITGQTAVGFSLGSAASPACPIIDRASPVHAMCASASAALALPTASPQRATSTNASMPPSLVTCQPQQDSWPTTALFAVDHSTGHGRPQVCGRSQNCFFLHSCDLSLEPLVVLHEICQRPRTAILAHGISAPCQLNQRTDRTSRRYEPSICFWFVSQNCQAQPCRRLHRRIATRGELDELLEHAGGHNGWMVGRVE